jgi:hypothetical protein
MRRDLVTVERRPCNYDLAAELECERSRAAGRSVDGIVSLTAAAVRSARPACLSNVESALISHHFDTPSAREDPRINVCDFYLFRGRPGFTVMAMTVNPDAGRSAPDTFRDEGLYAFRFDLNGDARETCRSRCGSAPSSTQMNMTELRSKASRFGARPVRPLHWARMET